MADSDGPIRATVVEAGEHDSDDEIELLISGRLRLRRSEFLNLRSALPDLQVEYAAEGDAHRLSAPR
jgi:hypothetical protein